MTNSYLSETRTCLSAVGAPTPSARCTYWTENVWLKKGPVKPSDWPHGGVRSAAVKPYENQSISLNFAPSR